MVKEGSFDNWEDARCHVCLDHPHNAVILRCSSYDSGCRAYVCDTSYRHSNCFEKLVRASSGRVGSGEGAAGVEEGNGSCRVLACPLCRGEVRGWIVDENACSVMDSKVRDCVVESCEFRGSYRQLRKHARKDHTPARQESWMRMEHEIALSELRGEDVEDEQQRQREAMSLLRSSQMQRQDDSYYRRINGDRNMNQIIDYRRNYAGRMSRRTNNTMRRNTSGRLTSDNYLDYLRVRHDRQFRRPPASDSRGNRRLASNGERQHSVTD